MIEDLFWETRRRAENLAAVPHADEHTPSEWRTQRPVTELEDRIDRLSMICCAMWTIIQAHTGASDEELVRLVQELDLTDGTLDGKAQEPQVKSCAACGRPVHLRHMRCIYCGAPRASAHPFEGVL